MKNTKATQLYTLDIESGLNDIYKAQQ